MDAKLWGQIKEIYDRALDLSGDEREWFLVEACGDDADLRREVESLLAAHENAGTFLQAPAVKVAARVIVTDEFTSTVAAELPAAPQLIGQELANYKIISLLGKGGMGEVYLAEDARLQRKVALKLLPPQFTNDADRVRRFDREARAISSLNHPNIVTVFDIGQAGALHFIAIEFIEGRTLRELIRNGRMKPGEALDVAMQVASALSASHAAGIVHRDIKPENIMLRPDGYVKVLDFGLSKLSEQLRTKVDSEASALASFLTHPGMVMGTVQYMSPEQARGLDVDARSDIFSLGVMFYEMIAGRAPFVGATTSDVIDSILDKEPHPLSGYSEEVSTELERVVSKALRKGVNERYQTAKDLIADLRSLKQELEFQSKLGRTAPLDPDAAATVHPGGDRTEAEISREPAPRSTSNAEYILSSIKRNKTVTTLVLSTFIIVVTAAIVYFSYFANRVSGITSIAVLPFANTSSDPNMEYLSDGISESLINALSELPHMKVIARGSAFKFKSKEIDPEEVARALGVDAIVTGRVRQRGDSLQVNAELVDVREKRHIWGERYNRQMADLQAMQEEIARRISEKLRLQLTGAEEKHMSKRARAKPEAYQLYLNGVFYKRKESLDNWKKAYDYFNKALAIDPNFPQALAEAANAYRFLGVSGLLDPKEAYPKAKEAAQKAIEVDETLADGHLSVGTIKFDEWDWGGAEQEFKRAIELNPNLAEAYFRYAQHLPLMGRFTEALAAIKRAQELDPLWTSMKAQEAACLFYARRYDEAIRQFEQFIKLEPGLGFAHTILGYAYASKGLYQEAIAEYKKSISLDGESTSIQCFLGYALALSGKRSEAQAILEKLKTTKEYVSPAELAVLYAALGDKEGALASLERAYAAHDPQMIFLKVDPHYDSLRSDPRFQNIMRQLRLTP